MVALQCGWTLRVRWQCALTARSGTGACDHSSTTSDDDDREHDNCAGSNHHTSSSPGACTACE